MTSVYRQSDHTLESKNTSSYGLNPQFRFKNLRPGENYVFEAVVIDNNGQPTTKKLDETMDNRMRFSTVSTVNPPNLATDRLKCTASEIVIPTKISNHQNIAYGYICMKRNTVENTSQVEDIEVARKTIDINEFGFPKSVELNPVIKISNLQPSTAYTITLTAINEYGKTQQITLSATTANIVPELQFTGGISIDFNPIETTISWKPNIEPHSGKVKVFSRDKSRSFEAVAIKVKDSLVAKIPYDDITKIIQWKNANAQEVPSISVMMDDDKGNVKEAWVSITFSVPNKDQINASRVLTKDQKDKLIDASDKLVEASGNPGRKVKWQDLVTVGIPILLQLL